MRDAKEPDAVADPAFGFASRQGRDVRTDGEILRNEPNFSAATRRRRLEPPWRARALSQSGDQMIPCVMSR
jgi:hypothetical protein